MTQHEAEGEEGIRLLLKRASYRLPSLRRVVVEADHRFDAFPAADEELLHAILDNPNWPLAAPPYLIVDSEERKRIRAKNILTVFCPDGVGGQRVLDIGTGSGHLARAAAEAGAAVSVGYDPRPRWGTTDTPALLLSGSWEEATREGPFHTIFLYDVLDHADDPVELLRRAGDALAPGGSILIRFHPWCGRHGGHLYRAANKAYLHLFLSDTAGQSLDDDFPRQKVIQPLKTYRHWVASAGLKMTRPEVPQIDPPESFFLAQREGIVRHWAECDHEQYAGGTFPTQPMSISFLDCVVGR